MATWQLAWPCLYCVLIFLPLHPTLSCSFNVRCIFTFVSTPFLSWATLWGQKWKDRRKKDFSFIISNRAGFVYHFCCLPNSFDDNFILENWKQEMFFVTKTPLCVFFVYLTACMISAKNVRSNTIWKVSHFKRNITSITGKSLFLHSRVFTNQREKSKSKCVIWKKSSCNIIKKGLCIILYSSCRWDDDVHGWPGTSPHLCKLRLSSWLSCSLVGGNFYTGHRSWFLCIWALLASSMALR